MSEAPETYQQLVDRVAWGIMTGFVRGDSLQSITHMAVQQTLMWSTENQKRIAEEDKIKRSPARKRK